MTMTGPLGEQYVVRKLLGSGGSTVAGLPTIEDRETAAASWNRGVCVLRATIERTRCRQHSYDVGKRMNCRETSMSGKDLP